MGAVALKDPYVKEVYIHGKLTGTSYGWMSYLEYRRRLLNGAFDAEKNEVEIAQVCVHGIDGSGLPREIDMTLSYAWDRYPGAILAFVDKPVEILEELGLW
ncbi:hypothetical protein [Desulfotruncus alcoholivorax]|uniref:hypothetical protein n=1 Tax=Desulfotruncus alcoholivorax TaxID=265477 RepID=UPI000423CAAC|nr:hypothetical protein [Desulfotruncus alcoholivorax]